MPLDHEWVRRSGETCPSSQAIPAAPGPRPGPGWRKWIEGSARAPGASGHKRGSAKLYSMTGAVQGPAPWSDAKAESVKAIVAPGDWNMDAWAPDRSVCTAHAEGATRLRSVPTKALL